MILSCWARHEYARLIDHGFFDEDDPIELLDGREPVISTRPLAAADRGFKLRS